MSLFLKILGIIFLIVVGVIGFFAWKVYRVLKKHKNSDLAIATSVLPALDIELEPSNAGEWVETERLAHLESELKRIGATSAGYYCVYIGEAIIRTSLWNFKNQALAVIYEGAGQDDPSEVAFFFEVASRLADGSVCISSNPHAGVDSRPPNHVLHFNESNSILDFFKAIKAAIPEGKKLVRFEDPIEFFTECYEDIAEWAWRPEQLSSDKIQQVLASVGVEVTDELMQHLIETGISYSVEVNTERARKLLARHSKMKADQWEKVRDKLVFVNDKMQVDHLIDAVYELAGDLSEKQEQALEGFQINTDKLTDPIGAFQMLVQSLNLKAKRITSMKSPTKTEVYLPL